MSEAHAGTDESNFIPPPALARRFWEYLRALQIAPPSEKLAAFVRASQLIAGLVGPDFPQREAIDRLWLTAEVNGLFEEHDENVVQAALAEGFRDPIFIDAKDGSTENSPHPPAFTDEALALRFAERHSLDLRYVAAWSKWLSWNGKCWQFDDTLHALYFARRVCREAAAECSMARVSAVLASAKTVAAVERLANPTGASPPQ